MTFIRKSLFPFTCSSLLYCILYLTVLYLSFQHCESVFIEAHFSFLFSNMYQHIMCLLYLSLSPFSMRLFWLFLLRVFLSLSLFSRCPLLPPSPPPHPFLAAVSAFPAPRPVRVAFSRSLEWGVSQPTNIPYDRQQYLSDPRVTYSVIPCMTWCEHIYSLYIQWFSLCGRLRWLVAFCEKQPL